MVALHQSIFISNITLTSSQLHLRRCNGGVGAKNFIVSKKDEQQPKKKLEKIQRGPNFSIKKILAQVGIGVLSLGFIDAGYSGDWSRIGVVSKENEDVLKAAAFLVVPICVYLIYLISQQPDEI